MTMIMKILLLAMLLLPVPMVKADEFDLSHRPWTKLLGEVPFGEAGLIYETSQWPR